MYFIVKQNIKNEGFSIISGVITAENADIEIEKYLEDNNEVFLLKAISRHISKKVVEIKLID